MEREQYQKQINDLLQAVETLLNSNKVMGERVAHLERVAAACLDINCVFLNVGLERGTERVAHTHHIDLTAKQGTEAGSEFIKQTQVRLQHLDNNINVAVFCVLLTGNRSEESHAGYLESAGIGFLEGCQFLEAFFQSQHNEWIISERKSMEINPFHQIIWPLFHYRALNTDGIF